MAEHQPGDLLALDPDRCVELLEATPFIRVAFNTPQGPSILPVNPFWVRIDVHEISGRQITR